MFILGPAPLPSDRPSRDLAPVRPRWKARGRVTL